MFLISAGLRELLGRAYFPGLERCGNLLL
jgi:hypothetical protein